MAIKTWDNGVSSLALSEIQTEFGGSNPISLNEYYAGGANVPSGTTGDFGALPTSGTIAVQKFYGSEAVTSPIQSGDGFFMFIILNSNPQTPIHFGNCVVKLGGSIVKGSLNQSTATSGNGYGFQGPMNGVLNFLRSVNYVHTDGLTYVPVDRVQYGVSSTYPASGYSFPSSLSGYTDADIEQVDFSTTLTQGSTTVGSDTIYGYNRVGLSNLHSDFGSIGDNELLEIRGGTSESIHLQIAAISYTVGFLVGLRFIIDDASPIPTTNDAGWNNLKIGNTTYTKSDADFFNSGTNSATNSNGYYAEWRWNATAGDTTGPFSSTNNTQFDIEIT